MAIRPIVRMGDPRLLQPCTEVTEFDTLELKALITDMKDTMDHNNGAGIAAPQIGVMLRVTLFGIDHNPRYPDAEAVPFTILINPKIEILTEEMDIEWEGCLSVPGLRGAVKRYTHLRYSGFTPEGEKINRDAKGFHARVVQHECDHLDGILYPVRMHDLQLFGFEDVLINQ